MTTAATTNPLVRQITEKTRSIEQKVQEFFDKVNDVLSWVPGVLTHLIEPIQAGLDALREKLQDFWNRINQFFSQLGDSDALKRVAEQWVNAVGNPIGETAGDVALPKMKANIEWEGRAAEAYKAIVPAQGDGLTSIKTVAIQMRTSLTNLANSIESFHTALLFALGGFLAGAVAAIAGVCGVVTTPIGIGALASAVGVAVALIGAAVQALNSHTNTIETEQAAIKQKIHDLGTKWSRSTTDMSDASVSDGDPSDWRVNS